MNSFANKWRIGEKIGFGFALVGSLFLLVIWQYHFTLNKSLSDFQQLHTIYDTKRELALNIELGLLSTRLAEKNFLLNHQAKDSLSVAKKIQNTLQIVEQFSKIDHLSQQEAVLFKQDLSNYQIHFKKVENAWIKKGLDENSGLQGSFRNAVHALEEMASSIHYDKLHISILQLRRREKDYLLRGDQHYIDLTFNVITSIKHQLPTSPFSNPEKEKFLNLLSNYHNDFMALVKHNKHIIKVETSMALEAIEAAQRVKKNVASSQLKMKQMVQQIEASTAEQVSTMLWFVLIAVLLGIYFSITITLRIVKPVRKMAIILEKLTHNEIVEKMHFEQDARDEINSMAGSLNLLADHRKRFINWWKSSMNEAESCAQLEQRLKDHVANNSDDSTEFKQITTELLDSIKQKKLLLTDEYQQIKKYNSDIIKHSSKLDHVGLPHDEIYAMAKLIHHKAILIDKSLEMVVYPLPKRE